MELARPLMGKQGSLISAPHGARARRQRTVRLFAVVTPTVRNLLIGRDGQVTGNARDDVTCPARFSCLSTLYASLLPGVSF
jgi:hypothetical protein